MSPDELDRWRLDCAMEAAAGKGFLGLMDEYRSMVRLDTRPEPGHEAPGPKSLVLEARAIVLDNIELGEFARGRVERGEADEGDYIQTVLAALRRGIEIGGGNAPSQ